MRTNIVVRTILAAIIPATPSAALQSGAYPPPQSTRISTSYGVLPLTFEANQGQTSAQTKFRARGKGYSASLTAGGMVLALHPTEVAPKNATDKALSKNTKQLRSTTIQFTMLGANPSPIVTGEDQQPGHVNYFIGSDPTKWHRNVPTYAKVRYRKIYPGIDLVYYGSRQQLEYDFVLAPGADPTRIQLALVGADQILINAEGNLVLKVNGGELRFQCPTVYQESNGRRIAVNAGYVVNDPTHISFHVAQYDSSKPLVIDPVLVYSTYLGGSGDDQPGGIAVDAAGNVYVTGSTDSTDFPLTTLGSLRAANTNVFVAKLDATGSNLIYTDYLGGNDQDYGQALALDAENNIYITGSTTSSDFPLVNPFQGTYPGSFNAFVSKISPDGSSLLYSTYFGGNGSDIPSRVAVDTAGDMIIAGYTSSTNLPVANAYQSTVSANLGGLYGIYGFLTKFSSDGSSLIYSTYFAGNSNLPFNCGGTPCWPEPLSSIAGMVLDTAGNAYVTGFTNTYNFPVTDGAYQTTDSTQQNGTVGFVSKFSGSGSLQYSTYFYDTSGLVTDITSLAVDGSGSAYLTGVTIGAGTFPITSTSICDPSIDGWGCNYAFATKFDPAGATLLYSTYLGPNNYAIPQAIVLDGNNDAYILAFAGSGSFSTVNGIENYSNGVDVLLVEIDAAGSTQLFATYLGGTGNDQPAPAGMVLDASGNVYVAGVTDSSDFPVTQPAFQSVLGGHTDAFILKIGAAFAPAVALNPASLQFSSQMVGSSSQPQTVLMRNMGSSPLSISTLATTGDFAETDNCGSSVSAAGTCTFSVTFTPTVSGFRSGTITIQDDAGGSPHMINLSGTGQGPAVTLTPSSLAFPSMPVGTSSGSQSITLANTGNMDLALSAIQAAGDYTQTNNCPASLAAGTTCTINVTFTPTEVGTRTGTVTISDNVAGSPQSAGLTGSGIVQSALVALTPASLTFASVPVSSSGVAQTVTLANTGNMALNISTIQIAGDYGQTNNCPASLAAGATCSISVTFTPTRTGTRTGTVTISDSVAGSPQSVGLSGAGSDFSLASSPGSASVNAGAAATYTLTVASVGVAFANAVKLSCSGAPAKTTCGLSSSSVTPGSNSATVTLTIKTTATSADLAPPHPVQNQPVYAMWMQLQALGLLGMMLGTSKRRTKKLPALVALVLLVGAMLFMSACAGGTGIAPQTQPGTTPGTYTITVSGTSGALQHSVPLTLTVQ